MKELLEFVKGASPALVLLVVLAYFLKTYLEKRLADFGGREEKRLTRIEDGLAAKVAEIGKTSLDLKKSLRNEERAELLLFRVAVEKWEYSLQTLLFDFTLLSATEAQIAPFYQGDKQLFLDVRLAVVRVSTYLRDRDLEVQLMAAISKIRNTYYPMIYAALPRLIDLQAKLIPLEIKMKKFSDSGMQDMAFAPTQQERAENLATQTLMTQETADFSAALLKEYRAIAEQLVDVKEAVNQYIYRPVHDVEVDKE